LALTLLNRSLLFLPAATTNPSIISNIRSSVFRAPQALFLVTPRRSTNPSYTGVTMVLEYPQSTTVAVVFPTA
jgi:hypothetical protein